MKNLLIAQSGGPTSVINATVAGIISIAYLSEKIDKIYGAVNGIEGVLKKRFIDIKEKLKIPEDIELLCQTPAAALGSCRFKLNAEDSKQLEKIISILREYEIKYFLYIGGNDSMDTVDKLCKYCEKNKIDDIRIVGIPKTIDNDLEFIDHCPGFGTAAKYISIIFKELERDCKVYSTKGITVVEVMGRNAGWLTAASVLAKSSNNDGPDLVYLPEKIFKKEKFIADIKEKFKNKNNLLIAVSEGIKNENGKYISENIQLEDTDIFGHKKTAGAGKILEKIIRDEFKCKVRAIEINLLQRCSAHIQSSTDVNEAKLLGMKGVLGVVEGKSGVMASLKRKKGTEYDVEFEFVPVSEVANKEKKVPKNFINPEGNFVTLEMIDYLKPLIRGEQKIIYEEGTPKHIKLY